MASDELILPNVTLSGQEQDSQSAPFRASSATANPPPEHGELTPRQLRGLAALVDLIDGNDGIPPTVRELAEADGCGIAPAHMLLMSLANLGLVRKLPNRPRGLAVTNAGRRALEASLAVRT